MHRIAMLVFVLIGALVPQAASAQQKRVALVIGNDHYTHLTDLRKAVNDANAVARALRKIGFDVILGKDLTLKAMKVTLRQLDAKLQPGDQLFFFYSGHGVAVDGENYLIPVDMPKPKFGQSAIVEDEALAVNRLLRRFKRQGVRSSFVVLDACRDNPFGQAGAKSFGQSRGLTEEEAPAGVFVLYAAEFGQTALDRLSNSDPDPNSVFTRKLLPLITTPGLSQVDIAKNIQLSVSDLALTVGHKQLPAYSDKIRGKMYLLAGTAKDLRVEPAPRPAKTASCAVADPVVSCLWREVRR